LRRSSTSRSGHERLEGAARLSIGKQRAVEFGIFVVAPANQRANVAGLRVHEDGGRLQILRPGLVRRCIRAGCGITGVPEAAVRTAFHRQQLPRQLFFQHALQLAVERRVNRVAFAVDGVTELRLEDIADRFYEVRRRLVRFEFSLA
jgi:hypothetical protein